MSHRVLLLPKSPYIRLIFPCETQVLLGYTFFLFLPDVCFEMKRGLKKNLYCRLKEKDEEMDPLNCLAPCNDKRVAYMPWRLYSVVCDG